MRRLAPALLATLLLCPVAADGSDHADPISLGNLDAGLTGLFVFPKGDELNLILTLHRGLSSPAPYDLEKFEYAIHLDLHSSVVFNNRADLARYGGTVQNPEGISVDATIRFRLTADSELQSGYPQFEGISGNGARVETGVYDDPFIFPRFFGTNIIAIAVALPMSSLPNRDHLLVWGTTTKAGNNKRIDHVGRSNRTQLGRLDFLNTLRPAEHVPAIKSRYDQGDSVMKGLAHLMEHVMPVGALAGLYEYVLAVREYDLNHPDVVIFSRARPAIFPNGRQLEDDVAGLTCAEGDCVLQEVAFIEGGWPRATVNDKDFSDTFPYLAPPHPEKPEEAHHVDRCGAVALVVLLLIVAALIVWMRGRLAKDGEPYVRPYRG